MKLTDEEVIGKIKENKLIIITGTTNGRTRIRSLIRDNIGPKRIIDTRMYSKQYGYTNFYLHKTTIFPLYMNKANYDNLIKILNNLVKKRRPVIVDSFTDVQNIIRGEFIRTMGEKTDEHKYRVRDLDWGFFKAMIKDAITKLKKYKKQVILFTDLSKNTIDGKIVIRTHYANFLSYEANLIIQAMDKDNLLIKEK